MFTKQYILNEIKRSARQNGSKPLGQARFQKETGIGPYEWTHYWARFGDALQDAGFMPNERWTRYSDELLIQKSIEKIRKYGKYPTINELRVEVNKGDDFPINIFKKRSQPYMVEKIIEYCRNKKGFEDIVAACNPILEKLDKKENQDNNTKSLGKIGEVYLGRSGHNYKIGKSIDVMRRGKEISIELPEKLLLIHSIITDDPSGVEKYWHGRFQSKRKNGEWFDLNANDVKAFKRWRKIY